MRKVIYLVVLLALTAAKAQSANYYSKNTGDITSAATWGTNADGTGSHPTDFYNAANNFILCNRAGAVSLSGNWTIASRLTINPGIDLEIGSRSLTVYNATCHGTIGVTALSKLFVKGTADTIYFEPTNNTLGTFTLYNGGSATLGNTLNIAAGGTPGVLKLNAGSVLNTAGNLRLLSDSLGSARIAESSGTINGDVTVLQYIDGGRRAYRFWSHPFSTNIALMQLQSYIDITGTGGPSNGFTLTGSNAPSVYRYDPTVGNSALPYDPGWRPFTNATSINDSNGFHPYQGIRMFIRGKKGEGLGYGSYTPSDVTIAMSGPVNQGNQTVVLSKGTQANEDYNMVGNPYPSPVDIGTVIYNAKVAGKITGSAFYVWTPTIGTNGQFVAVPIGVTSAFSYDLQANCAFQVRAAHDSDALIFTEADKSDAGSVNLMRTATDNVSFSIYDANYHLWDLLTLNFNDSAKDVEDDHDALKISGQDFNFYSISANHRKLAIDARPYRAAKTIPLGINSVYAKDFILKVNNLSILNGSQMLLHDKMLDKYITLATGVEYKFSINNNATSQGENRFELTTGEPKNLKANNNAKLALSPNPANDNINVTFTANGTDESTFKIFDLNGVCVADRTLGTNHDGRFDIDLNQLLPGVYIAELTSGDRKMTQRFVKQ